MHYLCSAMGEEYDFGTIGQDSCGVYCAMDPQNHKGLNPRMDIGNCDFKKCCKKYKKGKRCKKCPKR